MDLASGAEPQEESFDAMVLRCNSCGAETTLPESSVADFCAYCGAHLIASEAKHLRFPQPASILPFAIDEPNATASLRNWLKRVRFAPNDLKKYAELPHALKGVYIPYWCFDCHAAIQYEAERGEKRGGKSSYVTHTEVINGKKTKRTKQIQNMKWTPVEGRTSRGFQEVLVVTSNSLNKEHAQNLEPWDLADLVPFQQKYLAGFYAERYQASPEAGFEVAKERMLEPIREKIHSHIGGDEQRILSADIEYNDVRFRHIALPIWLGAYRYKGKVFQFVVNARSGEVQGGRPWSIWKVGLLILAVIALILFIAFSGTK